MNLKWLLLASDGKLDRETFWLTILSIFFVSMVLDEVGNSIFVEIGEDKISFLMFFITKMFPRLFGILILVFSFFVAKKRVNDIGTSEWLPIVYVLSLFLPTFLLAAGQSSLFIASAIIPLLITFYLGLASPSEE
ncbi:DUF805 domain-containing protein [bacterium]|jgi:uncharacterized membrane protein YhaH (DUF805 family)|nr:DUF805 domain-containing protein [bacterium]MBT3795575.1 DUF805 domain-containing protein [bacterium]MBT4634068.1 DUF805 domain-containing protein [bacterium]